MSPLETHPAAATASPGTISHRIRHLLIVP